MTSPRQAETEGGRSPVVRYAYKASLVRSAHQLN
jgi:hypothetical protein